MTTLNELESIISEGFIAYMRAGQAFAEIKTRKLYAPEYKSFGAYVVKKWGITPTHARRLRLAYECISKIEPIGCVLPATERVVRVLVGMPEALTALTLLTAQATLPAGGHLTYSHVGRARRCLEDIAQTGAVDIDGQAYAVKDLITLARPELLQAAYEAHARQREHIAAGRKFDAQKQLTYLTEKATPEQLRELARLLVAWLQTQEERV